MCGIVGFLTAEAHKGKRHRLDYLTDALIVDMVRGEDSTGVLFGHGLKPDLGAGFVKDGVTGVQFVNSEAYSRHILKANSPIRFAIGHNRAATRGNVCIANSHPFTHGKVIGLHNGTVRGNMAYLPITMPESKQLVDSSCIIMNLAHVDPDEAVSKVLSKIDGSYMLVWHDERDGSLNMARNNTRPMHVAQSYEQETLFFASEAGTLQWVAHRNGCGVLDTYALKPMQHLKFTDAGGLIPEVEDYTPVGKTSGAGQPKTTSSGSAAQSHASDQTVTQKPADPPALPAPATPAPAPGAGAVPGKSQAARAGRYYGCGGNKVLAGGRQRQVPDLFQSALRRLGLSVTDRLEFKPEQRQDEATLTRAMAMRYVTGLLPSIGLPALLYRIEAAVARDLMDKRWTVRPIGVTEMGKDGPMILAELVTTEHKTEVRTYSGSPTARAKTRRGDGLPGPEGKLLSREDWIVRTEGGCMTCGEDLTPDQADEIYWDPHTTDPQCPDCHTKDQMALEAVLARHEMLDGIVH